MPPTAVSAESRSGLADVGSGVARVTRSSLIEVVFRSPRDSERLVLVVKRPVRVETVLSAWRLEGGWRGKGG
jgi:hypothetical protein